MSYIAFLVGPTANFLLVFCLSKMLDSIDYSTFVYLITVSSGVVQAIGTPIAQSIIKSNYSIPIHFLKDNKLFSLVVIPSVLGMITWIVEMYLISDTRYTNYSFVLIFCLFGILVVNRVMYGFIDLSCSVSARVKSVSIFEIIKATAIFFSVTCLYPTALNVNNIIVEYILLYTIFCCIYIKHLNKNFEVSDVRRNGGVPFDYILLFLINLCVWTLMCWDRVYAYSTLDGNDVSKYYMVSLIGTTPSFLIGGMIAAIYSPLIFSKIVIGELKIKISKITQRLTMVTFAVFFFIIYFGDYILSFLYNEQIAIYSLAMGLVFLGSAAAVICNLFALVLLREKNLTPIFFPFIFIFAMFATNYRMTISTLSASYAIISVTAAIFLYCSLRKCK